MNKLINRICLILSINTGVLFTYILWPLLGGDYYAEGVMIFIIIIGIIIGYFLKYIFLNKNFVDSRIKYFAENMKKYNSIEKNKKIISDNKEEKIDLYQIEIEKQRQEQEKKDRIYMMKINNKEETTVENKKNEESIEKKKEKIIEEKIKKQKIKDELIQESKFEIHIKAFFKENILAKIGSILVFIGVLFLLSLIWNSISPMLKIIFGFLIGFGIYFSGIFLDKKNIKGESRILMGTGILINFLVILGARHILEGNVNNIGYLSSGISFILLIMNTIFGVITAIIYKSKNILFFSFIVAYLNPLLIGGNSDGPYTITIYSTIITIGALIISYIQKNKALAISCYILANILFLLAPLSNINPEFGWIFVFINSALISIITFIFLYKKNFKKLDIVFIINYVFIVLLIMKGGDSNAINNSISMIFYMISILGFFFIGIYLFIKNIIKNSIGFIVLPILTVLGLVSYGVPIGIEIVGSIVVLSYLIGLSFLSNFVSSYIKYGLFLIIGFFIISNNYLLISTLNQEIPFYSYITVVIISMIFMIMSYIFSKKENMTYLYSIGTIITIITLFPILKLDNNLGIYEMKNIVTIITITIFGIINTIFPFFNKYIIGEKRDEKNIILGSIAGLLFLVLNFYNIGNEYFPGITLGLFFIGLSIYYLSIAFLIVQKYPIEKVKSITNIKNTIYNFLGISLSLFTLSIAILFSKNPEIISIIWLIETTILLFMYQKTKIVKLAIASLIIFIIGLVKFISIIGAIEAGNYYSFIAIGIIFISFVLNHLYIESSKNDKVKISYNLLSIIGMSGVILSSIFIIDISPEYLFFITITSFLSIFLSMLYSYTNSKILKSYFNFIMILIGISIINIFESFAYNSFYIYHYLSSILFIISSIIFIKTNKSKYGNKVSIGTITIFLLTMLSMYVYDIFDNTFAVTIFWGIISIFLMMIGISKNIKKYRTIGLYLLSLVLLKISIYDVWYSIDDAISRVVVFIALGIMLIIVSIMYSKKYGNNLVGEFSLDIFSPEKEEIKKIEKKENTKKKEEIQNEVKSDEKEKVTKKIQNINIGEITSASFKIDGKIAFITRSKNLLQIVIYVINTTGLKTFEANELKDFHKYIRENYISELNPRDYKTVENAFRTFVEKGGEVILK